MSSELSRCSLCWAPSVCVFVCGLFLCWNPPTYQHTSAHQALGDRRGGSLISSLPSLLWAMCLLTVILLFFFFLCDALVVCARTLNLFDVIPNHCGSLAQSLSVGLVCKSTGSSAPGLCVESEGLLGYHYVFHPGSTYGPMMSCVAVH